MSSTWKPFTITSFPTVPLTTTFTPPPLCSGVYLPQDRNILMVDQEASCLPSGFKSQETSFFSPGIDCPQGYWSACHDTTGVASITTVTCCPFRGDISLACVTPSTLGGRWASLFCTWIAPDGNGTTISYTGSSADDKTSTVPLAMTSPDGINAFGVRMVFQSTDTPSSTPPPSSLSSSSPTNTGTGTTASTTTTTGAQAAGTPVEASSSGLSTRATAAIAVVIPVVVIAGLVGLFLLWRRRRRQQGVDGLGANAPLAQGPPENKYYYANEAKWQQPLAPQELPVEQSEMRTELPSVQNSYEMPVGSPRGPSRA
ncbi:hypothetical protein B0T24DRAFT_17520 [Lasiosphaeria ovina]|uniref:Uncharacterized protein n=1 Tax=Lasiosphaeria ovina TaxID=92902 RepID=A0AAE0TWX8_9PEZI|nr:hypothetical protein B0T24DRAFT_17520 [Lasiosphaeria ovina]